MYEYRVGLGNLYISIRSECPLWASPELARFAVPLDRTPAVFVTVYAASPDEVGAAVLAQEPLYDDGFRKYYGCLPGENLLGCLGHFACLYAPDGHEYTVYSGGETGQMPLSALLRSLPLGRILLGGGLLPIHASTVVYRGRALVIAAPSGVGKTTHSKLWESRGGRRISNDRALIGPEGGALTVFGYPFDGEDGVSLPESAPLYALLLIEQGTVDRLDFDLPVKVALGRLMRLVGYTDGLSDEKLAAIHLIDRILSDPTVRVCRFSATPTPSSVDEVLRCLFDGDGGDAYGN